MKLLTERYWKPKDDFNDMLKWQRDRGSHQRFSLTKWRETEKCCCMFGAEFRVRLMKIKIKYETGDTLN